MRSFIGTVTIGGRASEIASPEYAVAPSDTVMARVLAAGVAELVAVPAGAAVVNFAATTDFYAKFGTSGVVAAVPAADVTDGTASVLNPGTRVIPDGLTHISVIASAAGVVTLEFWG
jgi:hypothetical protein